MQGSVFEYKILALERTFGLWFVLLATVVNGFGTTSKTARNLF